MCAHNGVFLCLTVGCDGPVGEAVEMCRCMGSCWCYRAFCRDGCLHVQSPAGWLAGGVGGWHGCGQHITAVVC